MIGANTKLNAIEITDCVDDTSAFAVVFKYVGILDNINCLNLLIASIISSSIIRNSNLSMKFLDTLFGSNSMILFIISMRFLYIDGTMFIVRKNTMTYIKMINKPAASSIDKLNLLFTKLTAGPQI